MRFLLFSDIHGNYEALKTILLKHKADSFDAIYCLGDIVSGGANGDQVIELLQQYQVHCLMGNHDQFLLSPQKGLFPRWAEAYVYALLEWEQKFLSPHSWTFLKSLSESIQVQLEDQSEMLLCHATPKSRWALAPLRMDTNEGEMNFHYGETTASLILHGHDHMGTGVRHWHHKQIVNIASAGGRADGIACYTIVESNPVQFRILQEQVGYDKTLEQERMKELAVPLLEEYRREAD